MMEDNNNCWAGSMFHPDHKIWLEKDGAIFGDGLYKLLLNLPDLDLSHGLQREWEYLTDLPGAKLG